MHFMCILSTFDFFRLPHHPTKAEHCWLVPHQNDKGFFHTCKDSVDVNVGPYSAH